MSVFLKYFIALTLLTGIAGYSQCPVTNFSIPATGCINGNVQIVNSSTPGNTYQWDFCSGDLATPSAPTGIFTNSFLARSRSFKMVQSAGNWYGFAIDQVNNRMLRFDFGPSLTNTPTLTNLGSLGNQLQNPYDFFLYQESNLWYALIANTSTNNILKLQFGNNLAAAPVTTDLGSLGVLNGPTGIFGVKENGLLSVFVASGATQLVRIDFGSSINNTPTTTIYPVAIGSGLQSISIIKECDRWFGLITSYGNGKLLYADFINGIDQAPVFGEAATGLAFPATVTTALEGGTYYAFVQSAFPGNLYRVDFGPSIIDRTGTLTDLGNISGTGSSADNFAFTLAHQGSDWFGFFVDNAGSRLMRLPFASPCHATTVMSSSYLPIVSYSQAGTYRISQTVTDDNGNFSSQTQNITISSAIAPDINFTTQNICANHDVIFTSQNTSGNITNYNWTFGDATGATAQNPIHQYSSSGTFDVTLRVTASNTCQNFARKSIQIYNEPVADFTTPVASPLCTNQGFLFNNTTADVGFIPVWDWSVNGTSVSSSEDLTYTFTSTANQEVKLKASIPGCESEKAVNINTLVAGPKPDFTITGQCEDVNVNFTNTSTGTVTGYSWSFGDSQMSTAIHPAHIYVNPGSYAVMLRASNAAGCNNTLSKPLTIYSKPSTDFIALAPPFSCSGTPTQFNDLTPPPSDSNISSWSWNFGDAANPPNASSQKNPQHTYAMATDYEVALTVTTNFLCSSTLQKTITIHQTPTVDFTNSTLCEDAPVQFFDASSTNQAWNWQIGTAFYSTENPEHVFNNPGNYTVRLSATGSNNCIGTTSRNVVIPVKLNVDFTTLKSCVNQETEFSNITNDSSDPVVDLAWNFGGLGNATVNPATFNFLNAGNVNIELAVTTESGCEYVLSKSVSIATGPLAAFTALPNIGEAPLLVQFNNTSLNAQTYDWKFDETSSFSSTQISPFFVYPVVGNYTVTLVATDLQNCSDTTHQLIEVLPTSEVILPSPNPSTGIFTVGWETDEDVIATLILIDEMGREIQNLKVVSTSGINKTILDLTGQPSGMYILKINYLHTLKTYRLIISQ